MQHPECRVLRVQQPTCCFLVNGLGWFAILIAAALVLLLIILAAHNEGTK